MEKYLKDVQEHNQFWIVTGQKLRNLEELADVLDDIADEVFLYHVNDYKNDFYNWVKDCIEDIPLAESLLGVKDKKVAVKKIKERIKEIRKPKKAPVKKIVTAKIEKKPAVIAKPTKTVKKKK